MPGKGSDTQRAGMRSKTCSHSCVCNTLPTRSVPRSCLLNRGEAAVAAAGCAWLWRTLLTLKQVRHQANRYSHHNMNPKNEVSTDATPVYSGGAVVGHDPTNMSSHRTAAAAALSISAYSCGEVLAVPFRNPICLVSLEAPVLAACPCAQVCMAARMHTHALLVALPRAHRHMLDRHMS
jgi:hypothetical protein